MAKVKHYEKLITFRLDEESIEKIDEICGDRLSRSDWIRDAIHKKLAEEEKNERNTA